MNEKFVSQYQGESDRSRYSQNITGAQYGYSTPTFQKAFGVGAVLGSLLIGGAFTSQGQKMLASMGRNLSHGGGLTSLEKDLIARRRAISTVQERAKDYFVTKTIAESMSSGATSAGLGQDFSSLLYETAMGKGLEGGLKRDFQANLRFGGKLITKKTSQQQAEAIKKSRDLFTEALEQKLNRQLSGQERSVITSGFEWRKSAQSKQLASQIKTNVAGRVKQFSQEFDKGLQEKYALKYNINGMRPMSVDDVLQGKTNFKFRDTSIPIGTKNPELKISARHQENYLRSIQKSSGIDLSTMSVDKSLLISDGGELIDLRGIKDRGRMLMEQFSKFHVPFVGFSPSRILGLDALRQKSAMPFFHYMDAGVLQSFRGATEKVTKENLGNLNIWRTQDDLAFIGNRVISLGEDNFGKTVAENVALKPGKYGNYVSTFSNVIGEPIKENRGFISRVLDIGNQTEPTMFAKLKGIYDKFDSAEWGGNILKNISDPAYAVGRNTDKDIRNLRYMLQRETKPMDDDVFNKLVGDWGSQLGYKNLDLSTEEGVYNLLGEMATSQSHRLSWDVGRSSINSSWEKYSRNPIEFMESGISYTSKVPELPVVKQLGSTTYERRSEQVKTRLQMELMRQVSQARIKAGESIDDIAKEISFSTKKEAMQDIKEAMVVDLFLENSSSQAVVAELRNTDSRITRAAESFVKRKNPWYSYAEEEAGVAQQIKSQSGDFLVANKMRFFNLDDIYNLFNADDSLRSQSASNIQKTLSQLWAGRNNMEDFTTLSQIPYFLTSRLSGPLSAIGLGLGPESMGSAASIYGSLIGKRYLPLMAGIFYAGYASNEIKNLTGTSGYGWGLKGLDAAQEAYATIRDATGATDVWKHLQSLMPGSEMIMEIPGLSYLDPTKSFEEVKQQQEEKRPIRKGRWWLGSEAFIGGKIEYFAPNIRDVVEKDPMFTDVMYGSREEYYANAWLPTPLHPFAPLKHFITDPYHYENKHFYDRPYPITGPIPELADIPLVGPTLSATVGQFLKPRRRMHQKEMSGALATINNANQEEKDRAQYVVIGAAGQVDIKESYGQSPVYMDKVYWGEGIPGDRGARQDSSGSGRNVVSSANEEEKERYQISVSSESGGGQVSLGGSGYSSAKEFGRSAGKRLVSEANLQEKTRSDAGFLNRRIFGRPAFDKRYEVINPEDYRGEGSFSRALAKTYYHSTETAGIYGFLAQTLTGQPYEDQKVIQDASRMSSHNRAFWDANLGGMGFDLSEVGRRFVAREPRYDPTMELNPLSNMMPSWMPGKEYIIDFSKGDPYIKVARGEQRLPGGGYEALNEYNPDEMKLDAWQVSGSKALIFDSILNRPLAIQAEAAYRTEENGRVTNTVRKRLSESGLEIYKGDIIENKESAIRGKYDAMTFIGDQKTAINVKVVSSYQLAEIMKSQTPLRRHMEELNIALHHGQFGQGAIYYTTGQEDGVMLQFGYSPEMYAESIKKATETRGMIKQMVKDHRLSPQEMYDPIHRFQILADVAPYSEQYKYYRDYLVAKYNDLAVGSGSLEREEIERAKGVISRTKDQVTQMKKKQRFTNYRFKDADVDYKDVVVTEVLQNGLFLTNVFGDTPVKMAGFNVSTSKEELETEEYFLKYIHPGAKVRLAIDEDIDEMISNDSLGSIRAGVFVGGRSLGKMMEDVGLAKEREDDWSAPAVHARFTEGEIQFGKAWERLAHLNTPFHSRLLPVRTALERYERTEVYGKSFRAWEIKSQLQPLVESIASKNPISASLFMGMLGFLSYGTERSEKIFGAAVGGSIGLGLSLARNMYEAFTGDTWLPKRRIDERNLDEYFDILEYMKYRGLYIYAARKAQQEEGTNIDAFFEQLEKKREQVRQERRGIKNIKKSRRFEALKERQEAIRKFRSARESADKKSSVKFSQFFDRNYNKELTEREEEISKQREMISLGPWGRKALEFRQAFESTLYGMDSYAGPQAVMGALPKKDREYFAEFVQAKKKYHKRILELVPENQRRFLQAAWGEKVEDSRPDLDRYFKTHFLPGSNWEGWAPEKDLRDVKVRVAKNEGYDISEFGFWKNDVVLAEQANAPIFNYDSPKKNPGNIKDTLHKILKGTGLKDIEIEVIETKDPGIHYDISIEKDRREEMKNYFKENLDTLL